MINPPLIDTTNNYTNKKIVLVVPETLPHLYDSQLKNLINYNIVKVHDNRESILKEINGAAALIGCPRHIFDDDIILSSGGSLAWVHNPGAGIEHLLTDGLINSDIVFTNGQIIQGPECADHAVALLLALTRNIARTIKLDDKSNFPRPIELLGKKAVIIGLGGIGMCIAERLSAFGVDVTGVDDTYVPMLSSLKKIVMLDQLSKVVSTADIIFMSAPHTFKTNKIINTELIRKFKKRSYFINVSRGPTVDTDSLVFGMKEGILDGVGIDVTDPEPLPYDHKLREFDNTVVTSHIAGLSEFNRERSAILIGENIKRFVNGENLINIVDKIAGY